MPLSIRPSGVRLSGSSHHAGLVSTYAEKHIYDCQHSSMLFDLHCLLVCRLRSRLAIMQSALLLQNHLNTNMSDSPTYSCKSGGIPTMPSNSTYCVVAGGYVQTSVPTLPYNHIRSTDSRRFAQSQANGNLLRLLQQRHILRPLLPRLLFLVSRQP